MKQSYKEHQQLTDSTEPARRGPSTVNAKNDEEQLSMQSLHPTNGQQGETRHRPIGRQGPKGRFRRRYTLNGVPARERARLTMTVKGQWLETFLTVSPSRGATGWMNFRFHEGTLSKVLDLFLCNREKVFAGSSVKISMVLQGKASTRFFYVKSKKHLEKWQSEFSMASAQVFDLQPFTMN